MFDLSYLRLTGSARDRRADCFFAPRAMEATAWEQEAAERRRSRIDELVVEAQKKADDKWGKGEWTAVWVDHDSVQPNNKRQPRLRRARERRSLALPADSPVVVKSKE